MNLRHTLCLLFSALAAAAFSSVASAQAIRIDFRLANLLQGTSADDALDVHFNNTPTPTISRVGVDSASALVPNLQIPTSPLNVKIVRTGTGLAGPMFDRDVEIVTQTEYVAVVHGPASAPTLKVLARSKAQNPTSGKSLLRIFNAVEFTDASQFDFYIASTDSAPLYAGVVRDSATPFKSVVAVPVLLIITPNGSRSELARFNVPLVDLGRMTLVVTGPDAQNLKVYAISGERQTSYEIPLLQGAEGGTLPSIRVFHAWPEQSIAGKGKQSLDVYLDDDVQPRSPDLRYRTASEKFGPLTGDSVTVRFALHNEGIGSAVFAEGVRTRLDSDYVVILTKFSTGTAIAMTLAASNTQPGIVGDSIFIRVAQATDYYGPLMVEIISAVSPDTLRVTLPFLGSSRFYPLMRGGIKVKVYRDGEIVPLTTMTDPGGFAHSFFTVVVAGDDTTVTADLLDEYNTSRQVFDPLGDVPDLRARRPIVRVVPNVASTRTRVEIPSDETHNIARLDLLDPVGRVVKTVLDGRPMKSLEAIEVDVTGMDAGMYFVRLTTTDGRQGIERLVHTGNR